jgi:transcription elongation GreA/GreB family factor
MLLAFALSATGEPKNRTEAIRIFSSLAADPEAPSAEFRTQAAVAAIGNLVEGQRWDEARAFLSQLPPSPISTTALAALQGRVELSAGERQKASEFATQANASIAETTSHEDIRLTARFLADLGRHRDALPLWQRLASPTCLGHDSCRLIDSTLRLGEHRLLFEFCEQLRLNGIYDAQLIGLEAGIREHYDIEGTIGLLQEYLSRAPDDRNIRLQLSVIGIQRGRPELVSSDPVSMPKPEDTPPENWMAIVLVMKSGGHLWEALKLAYRLLRLNFGKIEAHLAYFASLLPTDPLPGIPSPDAAGPGTAVAFTQEGGTQIDWYIIEEQYEPDLNLQEIGPAHPAAQQLAGKRAGDTFVLAEGSVIPQRAKILQIVSKYAYRYADCGQNWMRRFPDHPDVQPVRAALLAGAPGGIDFTEFFQSFDRIIALHHEALEAYRSQPIPIHILARARGRNELEEMRVLAADDSSSVRCCLGNAEERSAALSALKNASIIVLDLTAIATISLLNAFDWLKHLGARLVISEMTVSAIQSLVEEYSTDRPRTGLGREGHHYVWSEVTPEAVRAQREYLESVIDKLRSTCATAPCPELAGIANEKREFLMNAVGEHGAQSIMLATAPEHVLWTDDFGMALLAAHEFGVRRVWTQVALQERAEAGGLSADFFTDATAKLLGWRYYFTSTGVQSLARAGEIAGCNPDRWPFKGALGVFSDQAILTRDVLSLAVSFILHYAGEVVLPQLREAVTVRILDRLSGRQGALVAVVALLRALPGAFGLNALRAAEITTVVHAWLAIRRIRLPT